VACPFVAPTSARGILAETVDYEATKRVLDAFERQGVRYVVFGAAALNFHGFARFTEDLDVFVAPDRDNILRLRRALRSGVRR
jgi:hypothetical protein